METNLEAGTCYEYREKKHSVFEASFAKKTKYEFDNRTAQYAGSKRQIDGCLIKNKKACDWLLELKRNNSSDLLVFIELKDSDLIKAIDQIENSIKELNNWAGEYIIHARIVLTKTYSPDINDNRMKKFIKAVKAKGGTVVYQSQKLIENQIA